MPNDKKHPFIARLISEYEDFEEADGDNKFKFWGVRVCYHALANDAKCRNCLH